MTSSNRQQPLSHRPSLPEGLNAAQLGAVQTAVLEIANSMKLKQWCIEKAVETDVTDRIAMAQAMYDFITALPTVIEAHEDAE